MKNTFKRFMDRVASISRRLCRVENISIAICLAACFASQPANANTYQNYDGQTSYSVPGSLTVRASDPNGTVYWSTTIVGNAYSTDDTPSNLSDGPRNLRLGSASPWPATAVPGLSFVILFNGSPITGVLDSSPVLATASYNGSDVVYPTFNLTLQLVKTGAVGATNATLTYPTLRFCDEVRSNPCWMGNFGQGYGPVVPQGSTSIIYGPTLDLSSSGVKTLTNNQPANGSAADVLEAFLVGTDGTFWKTPTTVNFSAASNGASLGASCVSSASTGKCTVSATSLTVGSNTSTVTVGGVALGGGGVAGSAGYGPSPASFSFVAVPPVVSAAKSVLTINPAFGVQPTNTGSYLLTCTVKDQFGNVFPSGVCAMTASHGTLSAVSCNSGVCTASLTDTTPFTDIVTATVNGTAVGVSPLGNGQASGVFGNVLKITSTKAASANPLIVGAAGQFYDVNVTVSGAVTSAALNITDTLPTGITLGGAPTVVSGVAALSGCPSAGNTTAGCSVAAGAPIGTFTVRLPVAVGAAAVGASGGTNSVNLSGGGDATCTASTGEACDSTTPTVAVVTTSIRSTKTASANPLVVGAPGQYYDITVNVGGAPTSAALAIIDTLPNGITLSGAPTVISGNASLSGCPSSGSTTSGCAIASGTSVGSVTIRVPVNVGIAALGPNGGTNTVNFSGGGDPGCTGSSGDPSQSSTPTVAVVKTTITTTKTASANPLLIGVVGQFYNINVTVANTATFALLSIADTLPPGITLAGVPTLIAGSTTGLLSGCPASGGDTIGCSVAAGVAPGSFAVRVPVAVAESAAGPTGGTNAVNLAGGGDPFCTASAGEACDATTTSVTVGGTPAIRIVKTVTSGAGTNVFSFALSGVSTARDAVTVVGASTATGSTTITGSALTGFSIAETSPAGWPTKPVGASCVDLNSATPAASFGTLAGNVLTVVGSRVVTGANIVCTFVNTFAASVSGRVFNDNGVGAGTPNDGIVNGTEVGIAGVTVVLSNCAGATYDTAVTDALGNYRLTVPFGTAPGAPLCATESTPTGLVPTNASVGSTQLPSGSAVTTGGTAYTYSRAPLVRIAFTWNGSGHSALDFGLVGLNTFAASEAKNGLPGTTVTYAHTFVAATGGSVSFTIPTVVDTPAISGWSGRIYADTGCTGTLQSGATVLYPPSLATTVTAGQIVCIVMQEFIPAGALSGYNDKSTVQASFAFSNSSPGLTASYAVNDATTVSLGALDLKKEVSNVTQSGAFGLNNQARSGETLEYRITYTNNGTTPIRNLVLSDSTPSFTSFVGSLTGTTPATLTACVKNTPANPLPAAAVNCAAVQAAGGSGTLNWNLTGSLNPGDSGTVLFRVKVN